MFNQNCIIYEDTSIFIHYEKYHTVPENDNIKNNSNRLTSSQNAE